MTVCCVRITVTGSTIVDAAVVQLQISNLQGEGVFGRINGWLEVSHSDVVLFAEELYWSSVVFLSVPVHGVAAHTEPLTHAAHQCHCDSSVQHLISRLKNNNSETCSTLGRRQIFSDVCLSVDSHKLVTGETWQPKTHLSVKVATHKELWWAC